MIYVRNAEQICNSKNQAQIKELFRIIDYVCKHVKFIAYIKYMYNQ